VIAIVMIILVVRVTIMPESKLSEHIKFAIIVIIFFIFVVTLTKMYNPTGFLFFGLFFIIIVIVVMSKINKGSTSSD
jgi:hypothetical protein